MPARGLPDGRGLEAEEVGINAAGETPADALCRVLDDHITGPGSPAARGHAAAPDLKVLDDEVVLAFAPNGPDQDDEDPEALAAVFASTSPRARELLKESFFKPASFYLGGDSARLVIDPIPDFEDEDLYSRVGATVVADEQAAARELLTLTAAATGARHRREREVLGSPSRLERLRADMRTSWRDPALSTGQLEAQLESPGRRGLLGSLFGSIRAFFGLGGDGAAAEPAPGSAGPTWKRRIPEAAAEIIQNDPCPGVAVVTNNKGGTGKTTISCNLAAAASLICVPKGWQHGLSVLLIEQNYGNSDIRDRVRTPGSVGRGLLGFVEDLRSGRDPDIIDYVTPVSGLPDFDTLLISDRDDEYKHAGTLSESELDALYESAADYYSLIVVDLDKGLPQEPTMVADVLRYWLTVCDVTFLVLDGSGTSHTQALKFSEGAHEFFEREAATGGEPRPLVPVKNKWREGERWGASADDPEEWDRLTRQLGADWAVDRDGNRVPYLKVPDDPQCDAFARQARQIALADEDFALTFEEMARDWIDRVVQSRLAEVNEQSHQGGT